MTYNPKTPEKKKGEIGPREAAEMDEEMIRRDIEGPQSRETQPSEPQGNEAPRQPPGE